VAALKKQNSSDVGRRSLRSVPAVAPGWDAFCPIMVGAFKRCLAAKDIHQRSPLGSKRVVASQILSFARADEAGVATMHESACGTFRKLCSAFLDVRL
jgi:hypothetical protein